MPGNRITVTLKHKETGDTRTVEVTGATHTQKSAEEHVAGQYGEHAKGRGAPEARMWDVVPKFEAVATRSVEVADDNESTSAPVIVAALPAIADEHK